MSKLVDGLVEHILQKGTVEKEELGNIIVAVLGGDSGKSASNLPKRKGNQDGGIDGRVSVVAEVVREDLIFLKNTQVPVRWRRSDREVIETVAAFNVKLENKLFGRSHLALFKSDMDREQIKFGVIISARGLSPDAQMEMERYNNEGGVIIRSMLLADLLSGDFNLEPIQFQNDPKEILLKAKEKFLSEE